MKWYLIISIICAPLNACSADNDRIFTGRFVWGAEVITFQACHSNKVYWVSASSWIQGPLLDFYKNNVTKPYQPVYIQFRGQILDEKVDGFAAYYDGLMRISEIKKTVLQIPEHCK
jgi:hypothetical protein